MSNDQSLLDFYAPPKSLAIVKPHDRLNFLGNEGRIGRLRYIAWLTVGVVAITGGYFLFSALFMRFFIRNDLIHYNQIDKLVTFLGTVYFLLVVSYAIRCSTQRVQDFNCNKWLAFILIIPLLNLLIIAIFMIIPGNAEANKYGSPAPPNSKAVILLASIFFISIGFLLIIFAL